MPLASAALLVAAQSLHYVPLLSIWRPSYKGGPGSVMLVMNSCLNEGEGA